MHTGQFTNIEQVIEHYNIIPNNPANTNLDPRLRGPGGVSQNLQLSTNQKLALAAFLRTLSGNAVYTDERWSNPFDSIGNITIIPKQTTGIKQYSSSQYFQIFPNPAHHIIQVVAQFEDYQVDVFSLDGKKVFSGMNTIIIPISDWQNGIYQIQLTHNYQIVETRKFIKL
jgi:cytochrome c peroxidase